MISFVWPDFMPFVPWAGGSEVYTYGQLQELLRRGIPTRMIACNTMVSESIKKFTDIPLLTVTDQSALSELDDTLIFVFLPVPVKTKHPALLVVHTTIKGPLHDDTPAFAHNALGDMHLVTTSRYMAQYWQDTLDLPTAPPVVYPFADAVFSAISRPLRGDDQAPRVLFAGRPTQEKGVYTLMASLHMPPLHERPFELSCITNINHKGGDDIVNSLFAAHPRIRTIPAQHTRQDMARLYAAHDIVVMPSSSILWKEAFGMTAVEAQQAGCWVVASDDGGLPETDCGGLILVKPDDPLALAEGIAQAIELGPLPAATRKQAANRFTVAQSVDALLQVIGI
jgi:D-inositol-3-phosphate glycosyltransferase